MDVGGAYQVIEIPTATWLPLESGWLDALVEHGLSRAMSEELLWPNISMMRGLAAQRLWLHDAVRFNRLFKLWQRDCRLSGEFATGSAPVTVEPGDLSRCRHYRNA